MDKGQGEEEGGYRYGYCGDFATTTTTTTLTTTTTTTEGGGCPNQDMGPVGVLVGSRVRVYNTTPTPTTTTTPTSAEYY